MKIKILLFFIILHLVTLSVSAQEKDSIDNLILQLEEKDRIEFLLKIATKFTANDPQKSSEYIEQALKYLNKFPDEKKRGEAYSLAGKAQYYLANYDSALIAWEYALEIYEDIKYDRGIAEQYNSIGVWYYSAASNYDKALNYYFLSLKKREEIKDSSGIASSLINIGNIYYKQKRRDKAIESFEKALFYAEAVGDKKEMSILFNNLGAEYEFKKEFKKALAYYLKSAEIKKELNSNTSLAVTYGSIGSLYKEQKKYDNALEYYNKAIEILKETSNRHYTALIYNYISGVYKRKKNYKQAIFYLEKSQTIAVKIKDKSLLHNNYKEFSEIYASLKKFDSAYIYQKSFIQIHDSIFSKESDKRMKDIEIKYASEKKNKENEILKRQHKINELELEKKTNRLYYLIVVSSILFLLVLIAYNRYRYKQKTNIILENANNKLIISERKLQETVDTKDKFFSIIAHDLRNPLSSLTLISQVLDESIDDFTKRQLKHYIKSINDTTNNINGLVENLLNWARAQTNKIEYNPKKIDLHTIIIQNINLLKTNIENKNINIENKIKENTNIYADINLITTVIRNLLANAVKFTNKNGKITFSVTESNDFLKISVKDTGIGINKNDLEKLFRIDIDTKSIGNSSEKGTGLGLILCKEFIEKSGGTINVTSELEKGTTFIFSIKKG